MAYSLENTTDLTALGNAIRAKTGSNAAMTVVQMATAVAGITGDGGSSPGLIISNFENVIDSGIVDVGKYDAYIDLSGYINAPFLIICLGDSEGQGTIGYFNGTSMVFFSGQVMTGVYVFDGAWDGTGLTLNLTATRDLTQVYIIT